MVKICFSCLLKENLCAIVFIHYASGINIICPYSEENFVILSFTKAVIVLPNDSVNHLKNLIQGNTDFFSLQSITMVLASKNSRYFPRIANTKLNVASSSRPSSKDNDHSIHNENDYAYSSCS